VKAQETTLQQLVQGEKQFVVPLYQRPYSWRDPQLKQLWADIVEQAETLAQGQSQTTHFIGSVVLAPTSDLQAAGVQRWIVVDGQQRLTTLMLLLCALRDHMAVDDPTQLDRFDELYLLNKWQIGNERFRLFPTQADREAFLACVLRLPEAGSGDGVGAAFRFFRRAIVEADDPADPHDVARIEAVVRERLAIVEITAARDDNVYRIFESLNNTGLRLSQADLIRNYLFMRLPTREQEVYDAVWLPMQDALPGDQLELLMYLDLVLRGEERARREDLYTGHQERIRALADEEAVVAYMVELAMRASLLRLIIEPSQETDDDVRAGLERLRAWGVQVVYPPVMALLQKRHAEEATSEGVAEGLGFIESFVVRRMVNGVYTGNLNRIFQALTGDILATEDVATATRKGLSGPRLYWPTDEELREAIRAKPFYWTGRHNQRFFVLKRLEESFPSGERAALDQATLTIEHVLPQTVTPDWLAAVEEDTPEGEDPMEFAMRLVHTLGNLTLSGYNAELSNSPFSRKRELLASSNLEINRPIAAKERWGPTEILERADDLARRAVSIWPGPDESIRGTPQGRDWELLHQALAAFPAGAWTSYSDLAELVGSHPVPVGVHIARTPLLNGHRALAVNGQISGNFRWYDPEDARDPRQVLEEEGVRFIEGHADPAQRVTANELAALVGLSQDVESREVEATAAESPAELDERHARFLDRMEL
jgi:alkylated DNA nucleotide flippase Atl1